MLALRLYKLKEIMLDRFLIKGLLHGTAAGVEHQAVLKNLDLDFILDVGANRGQFALISRKIFPDAIIHSFEPLSKPAEIFKQVFQQDQLITLHECALGREKTVREIHVTRDDDSSSLLAVNRVQSELFPGSVEVGKSSVLVMTLKEAINIQEISSKAFLKIDVQGYEMEVLLGCEEALEKIAYIYVECSFVELYSGQPLAYEVISWLLNKNFSLCGVYNLCYTQRGIAVQGDFLFHNRQMK